MGVYLSKKCDFCATVCPYMESISRKDVYHGYTCIFHLHEKLDSLFDSAFWCILAVGVVNNLLSFLGTPTISA